MARLHVRDLMTDEVMTLDPADDLGRLYDLVETRGIRHVPVVDAERMVRGIVTERDLLRVMRLGEATVSELRDRLRTHHVSEIMTHDVVTTEPGEDLGEAARLLFENKLGCLPVVDGEELVGIITESDFVQYFIRDDDAPRSHAVALGGDEDDAPRLLEAHVMHGHLVLREPIGLPEGTAVHLAIVDDLDGVEEEQAAPPSLEHTSARAPDTNTSVVAGEDALGNIAGD